MQKEKSLRLELKILLKQQAEAVKKNEKISGFQGFIDKALKLDIHPAKWSRLAVTIDEPVSYPELEEILNQCSNKNAFYFKPDFIEIKKQDAVANPNSPNRKKSDLSDGKKEDVNLKLKGTFIVKNK